MTCATVTQKVLHMPEPPKSELLTGAGVGSAVQSAAIDISASGYMSALFWLCVDGETAAPANLPTVFRVLGSIGEPSATNTDLYEVLSASSKLCDKTDWAPKGCIYIEMCDTHLNMAMPAGKGGEITHLVVEIEGASGVSYRVSVTLCDPACRDSKGICESLS